MEEQREHYRSVELHNGKRISVFNDEVRAYIEIESGDLVSTIWMKKSELVELGDTIAKLLESSVGDVR